MGWTGSGASCVAGSTAQTYRDAVAQRLNWFRLVAGVPPGISLDSTNNAKEQQAALMMSVNKALNHFPPASWQCYTADGAEAAGHSNLCYSTGASYLPGDPGCVEGYMNDFGPGNGAIGHRRWLLYPQTQVMGTGDVPAVGTYFSANALWAWDSNYGGSRPGTRDGFVAWPPRGYIPAPLVFGRWSFSYPGASFDSAAVAMRCNGAALPLTQLAPANGYGENTLVWEPAACTPPAGTDAVAEVSVSNVAIGGGPQNFAYTVRIFDPNAAITERIGVYRSGQWQLDTDGDGVFNFGVDKGLNWGWSETTPVYGDWNGDGKQEVGFFINGLWYLDYNGDGVWDNGVLDKVYGFGMAGVQPVVGDWNGDGKDEIGIYTNGFWFLDMNGNGVWDGEPTDKMIIWGFTGSTPVIGDWNGDGRKKVGLFYNGLWYLDYNGDGIWDGGVVDKVYGFGMAGVQPMVGDWNGDGKEEIGIYIGGFWFLDMNGNGVWDGEATDRMMILGWTGTTPVVGDWNGDGKTKVGTFINGYWYLDYNGNGAWDGESTDKAYQFGQPGDTPVVGRW